jgi:integrase
MALGLALAWPTWGPNRLAAQLTRSGVGLAPSTIYRLLRRSGLGTRARRLAVLEHHSAQRAGLLTERTRRRLWAAQHGRTRHVEAQQPGELLCLDSFYIGKLKGVGPLWQLTACDAACSYGVARIVAAADPQHCAAFLCELLVPLYRQAGWRLQRVLTDGGPEFRAAFDQVCARLGVRHTRTQPRHAWTNGFVERLQGTILHEHLRIAFRRQYFTTARAVQRSLDRVPALLQPRAAASGLSPAGPHPCGAVLGRGSLNPRTLGSKKCQHHYEAGHPRAGLYPGPAEEAGRDQRLHEVRLNKAIPRYLTTEEQDRLLIVAHERMRRFLMVGLRTGMRPGEIRNLRWGDFDFSGEVVIVRGSDEEGPKSRKERSVPLAEDLRDFLLAIPFPERRLEDRVVGLTKDEVENWFKRHSRHPAHILRHTFATEFVKAGGAITVLKEILGHASVQTTMVYAHHAPNLARREINKLPSLRVGGAIGGATPISEARRKKAAGV